MTENLWRPKHLGFIHNSVVGWCQGFLPSQAKELTHGTTRSAYKVGFIRERKGYS
jgi:hypothetical protein